MRTAGSMIGKVFDLFPDVATLCTCTLHQAEEEIFRSEPGPETLVDRKLGQVPADQWTMFARKVGVTGEFGDGVGVRRVYLQPRNLKAETLVEIGWRKRRPSGPVNRAPLSPWQMSQVGTKFSGVTASSTGDGP